MLPQVQWQQIFLEGVQQQDSLHSKVEEVLSSLYKQHQSLSDGKIAVFADKEEQRIYKDNDKAYQLLMTYCTGLPYGVVKMGKTK